MTPQAKMTPSTTPTSSPTTTGANTTAYDNIDPAFHYIGVWTQINDTNLSYYKGTDSYSNDSTTPATVTFMFTGTRVQLHGTTNTDRGIYGITLDSNAEILTSAYSPTQVFEVTVYDSGTLPKGPHTLTIRVTGTSDPSATDTIIDVDDAKVFP